MPHTVKEKPLNYCTHSIIALISLMEIPGVAAIETWHKILPLQRFQVAEKHEAIKSIPDALPKCTEITTESLLQASQFGFLEQVEELLRCGVAPNTEAHWRQEYDDYKVMELTAPPIHAAAWNSHEEIVQVLIDAGADVNALDEWGFSPLMTASEVGAAQVAELLISNGAEVNLATAAIDSEESDWQGDETALTIAAGSGHAEVVALLLRSGADKEHRRGDNLTALEIATQLNHDSVVELLQSN